MPALRKIKYLAKCSPEGGQDDIHIIEDGALVWHKDTIQWVGKDSDYPSIYSSEEILVDGANVVLPGLIDCHTHLAFGGWRDNEFERRMKGESYESISKSGGGIKSTVKATREATKEELLEKSRAFLKKMLALGITTVEAKSGYGLDKDTELKLLSIYKELSNSEPQTIMPTFLGAHTVPEDMKREDYIRFLIDEMIPLVAREKLAVFCDVFCESVAFSVEESREILNAAKKAGLKTKVHADQLGDSGGSALASEVGAISADHLEYINDKNISKMVASKTVGVILPFASLYLKKPFVNGKRLVDAGLPVAVATDFNPGTAPTYDLPLALRLSVLENGLTPTGAIKAGTYFAALALGIEKERGSLDVGKKADFIVLDAISPTHWIYHHSLSMPQRVFVNGQTTFRSNS